MYNHTIKTRRLLENVILRPSAVQRSLTTKALCHTKNQTKKVILQNIRASSSSSLLTTTLQEQAVAPLLRTNGSSTSGASSRRTGMGLSAAVGVVAAGIAMSDDNTRGCCGDSSSSSMMMIKRSLCEEDNKGDESSIKYVEEDSVEKQTNGNEQNKEDTNNTTSDETEETNETPKGQTLILCVKEDELDQLVDEIMSNPKMTIRSVPDTIERRIYKSVIQLTLNTVYSSLSNLHGMPLLSHELRLVVDNDNDSTTTDDNNNNNNNNNDSNKKSKNKKTIKPMFKPHNDSIDEDEKIFEQIANQLLSNKTVNISIIPDFIERQLYINCLKIVIQLVEALSQSLSINVVGHTFRLLVEQDSESSSIKNKKKPILTSSLITEIDIERLRTYASTVTNINETDGVQLSLWNRLVLKSNFVTELHSCLYGFILTVLDDLLSHTNIEILSDNIHFDIVVPPPKKQEQQPVIDVATTSNEDSSGSGSVGFFATASFAVGVGVGVSFMAFITTLAKKH